MSSVSSVTSVSGGGLKHALSPADMIRRTIQQKAEQPAKSTAADSHGPATRLTLSAHAQAHVDGQKS